MLELGNSLAASWFLFFPNLTFSDLWEKSVNRICFPSSSTRSGKCSHSKIHHYDRNSHALQYLAKHFNNIPQYHSQNPQSSLPPGPHSSTTTNLPNTPRASHITQKHLEHPERKSQRTKPNSRSSRRRRRRIRVARRRVSRRRRASRD
jgi:hypothetical protein